MNALTKRIIVISFDCLSALDFPKLTNLTHFRDIIERGSYANQVQTIYPSLTYPCHTSIITGNYPKRHGIINNTLIQPGRKSPDWQWYRSSIKGTTLYDQAKKANLTTASLLWPVTGRANIDYNLPEIFPNRPWQTQLLVSLFSGSPLYQWQLNKKFGYLRQQLSQPYLDDFVLASCLDTIKTKQPHLLLVHFTDLDSKRHDHGFDSREANEALTRHNERLGQIIATLKEIQLYEETTVIVLGDHSALDENKAIQVNTLFKRENFIHINKRGKLISWKAYCKSCDGSAYIYIKDKEDTITYKRVQSLLTKLMKNEENGIEQILTGSEAANLGADPTCAFMLEARKGFYFTESYEGDFIKHISAEDVKREPKYTLAAHGYSPQKPDYSTVFMAAGKGVSSGQIIPNMHLVDIGPTLAAMLGLSLGETDGKVIEAFIQSKE
jgi:predicted AlkP superfamily pyrophosphatase or phosphodiesterase